MSLTTLWGLSCNKIYEIAKRPKEPEKPKRVQEPVEWGPEKHEHEEQGVLEQEAPKRDSG